MRAPRRTAEYNFWPSVADMILAALMVLLILWFAEGVRSIYLINIERSHKTESTNSRVEIDRLRQALADAQMQIVRLKQKPPIITLDEAQNYRFETGSAALSAEFKSLLELKIVPQLKDTFDRYPVNTVEIIGHTDTQPVSGRTSNLDTTLLPVLAGAKDINALTFGSNADLGLMRAVAIRLVLEKLSTVYGLQAVRFRTYSAAQTVSPPRSDAMNSLQDTRRRIEMRFTRTEE
jgi:outer membrane protein OmpA-like peptidoglycan-associated protein